MQCNKHPGPSQKTPRNWRRKHRLVTGAKNTNPGHRSKKHRLPTQKTRSPFSMSQARASSTPAPVAEAALCQTRYLFADWSGPERWRKSWQDGKTRGLIWIRDSYGFSWKISWWLHGDFMGISWRFHEDFMGFQGIHGDSMGISWGFHGDFMGFHEDFMGFQGIHGDVMGFNENLRGDWDFSPGYHGIM